MSGRWREKGWGGIELKELDSYIGSRRQEREGERVRTKCVQKWKGQSERGQTEKRDGEKDRGAEREAQKAGQLRKRQRNMEAWSENL